LRHPEAKPFKEWLQSCIEAEYKTLRKSVIPADIYRAQGAIDALEKIAAIEEELDGHRRAINDGTFKHGVSGPEPGTRQGMIGGLSETIVKD